MVVRSAKISNRVYRADRLKRMAEDSRAKSITASNGIGSWHPLVAGAIAGVFSKTILQPLDLVKTRLQVQEVKKGAIQASESAQTAYRGVVHGLSTIIKFEGVSALYTGLAPNLLGSGMAWGCYFFVYTNAKQMLMTATSKEKLGPSEHLQCAAVSGVFTTIITNPIWLIKTRVKPHDILKKSFLLSLRFIPFFLDADSAKSKGIFLGIPLSAKYREE